MKTGIVATGARPTPAVHHFLPQTPDLESATTATTTTPRETPPSQTPKQPRVIRRVKIVQKKQPAAAETTTADSATTTSEQQQQQPHTTTTTMVKKQRRASTGKMSTSAAAEQSPRVLVKKVVTTTTRRYSLPKSAISSSSECSHEESNTVRKPGKKKAQRRVSFAMDSSSKENTTTKNGGAGPEFSTPPTSPDNSESSEASEFSLTVDEIPVSVISKEDGRLILSPKRATQKADATPPVSPSRKKKKSVSSSLDAPHSPSRKSKKSSSSSSDGPSSPSKSPSKSKKKSVSSSLSSCPESPSKSKKSKSSSSSKSKKSSSGSESPRKDSSSSPRKSAIDKKAVKHFLPHPPIADNSKTTPSVKHFLPPPPVAGAEDEADKKKRNFNRWAPIPTFSNGSLLEDDNDVREAYKMHRKWMADDASLCNKPVFNSFLSPSAIRIQAAVRAHLQRKQYLSQRKWAQVQQRYTLMTEAATTIQAHTRGYLVWNYMRVPLLQHKLKRIEEAHERELQEIQRNKWSKMKAMRQQAMAEHNLDATTELECIHEAWSDTKAEIHKMRKENEILRQENDKLSQATRIFAAKNHKLIINLEKTKHMTAQLEANLPELEKESQRFVQVEAQFRERWMQYRTAMQEGGELLQMEQVVSSKYWQSICDICQKVRHNARHVQPKNHDLAVEVQAIVKQETQRNALLPNVPSSENAPVSGSVFDEEDETEGTSSSSSDSDDNSKRQRRRVSFAP